MHERIRAIALESWARLIARHPRLVLLLCTLGALGGAGLAYHFMEFHPDRSDLVARDLAWNARYAGYKAQFSRWGDVLVGIEGTQGDERVDVLVREIAAALQSLPEVRSADAGFHRDEAPRLILSAPATGPGRFETALEQIALMRRLSTADNVNAALFGMLGAQREAADDGEALAGALAPYIATLNGVPSGFALPGFDGAFEHFTTATGRIRLIFVRIAGGDSSTSGIDAPLAAMRSTIADVVTGSEVEVEWGVTGVRAIEADETRQSILDSTRASILALVLITALMLAVYRGIRVPLAAIGALVLAMGWAFGWVVISVGHLQLLSIVFSVVLLGLAVDFAVHLAARFEVVRDEHAHFEDAAVHVFRAVGPGLLTGGVTTAAAFLAIALTDFRGAAELGVISGGGIVICLVAIMSAFPAFLALQRDWKQPLRSRQTMGESSLAKPLFFVHRHPVATFGVSVVAVLCLGVLALQVKYDPNILHLQPPGVQSVEWEARLIEADARSSWAAISLVDPDEAFERANALRSLDVVDDVDGMGLLLPPDLRTRLERVDEARQRAVSAPAYGAGFAAMKRLLQQVADAAVARRDDGGEPSAFDATIDELVEALGASATLSPEQKAEAWSAFNESFLGRRAAYAAFAERALAPGFPTADDLPRALREMWVGRDGSWLLRAQPAQAVTPVLDPGNLTDFVTGLRTVDPNILGPPVQIYESSELIQAAYIKAALFALPAILIVLLLDFRSPTDAISAVLPVVIGFVGAFGLMQLVGVPLNFANMIVMPIILGIGVDAGVHVVHRWRESPNGVPPGLSGGTGRGITVTMLTTMVGFGCMLIAEHRGIRSLGFVMVVGLGTTLIACMTTLPALLAWRGRRRPSA